MELAQACELITRYAGWLCMPLASILIRLDGLYGTTGCAHTSPLVGDGDHRS